MLLRKGWLFAAGLAVGCASTTAYFVSSHAFAQTTQFTFIVPGETQVQSGTTSDVLVVTGRSTGTSGAGACQGGSGFPVQNGVVIAPGTGSPASRLTGFIVINTTTSIPPGGKLINIQLLESCNGPDGSSYNKFTGDLEA